MDANYGKVKECGDKEKGDRAAWDGGSGKNNAGCSEHRSVVEKKEKPEIQNTGEGKDKPHVRKICRREKECPQAYQILISFQRSSTTQKLGGKKRGKKWLPRGEGKVGGEKKSSFRKRGKGD